MDIGFFIAFIVMWMLGVYVARKKLIINLQLFLNV